jgi:hypothetical protein
MGRRTTTVQPVTTALFNGLKKVQPVPDLGLYLTGFSDTQQIGIAV